jgi:hypothetical protein
MDQSATTSGTAQAEPMPFTDKLANIIASPATVYENVRDTAITHSNWVIPTLILVVVGTILGYVVMSNPSLSAQFKHIATEQMEKQFEKSVAEGKMTAEQAEQARGQMESFGTTGMLVSRIAGGVVGPFITLFAWSLVYWLLGKGVMKAVVPYWKVVEVVGLAFIITVMESIVTTILAIALDRVFAAPGLGLLISDFSMSNKWHMFAATMNIFTFWNLAVVSVGLSKVFQKDFPKVLVLVFAIWLIWTVAMVFGLGSLRA